MSIESWKAEFYQTDAKSTSSIFEALDHSIVKWKGMLPRNASRHGITHECGSGYICDETGHAIPMDNHSCALCMYMNDRCADCPLRLVGNGPCYISGEPFDLWYEQDDARAIVRALIDAKRLMNKIKRAEDAEAMDIQRNSPLAMPTRCKTTTYI